jgi:cell division protein FtsB
VSAAAARVAARPAARPAPRAQPSRPAPRKRRKPQRGVRSGIVWIIVLGLVLTGVVAINVAVLRQNMQLERFGNESAQLRDQNLKLSSQLSQVTSPSYIEQLARTKLGLVQVASDQTTYIRLGAGGK